MSTQVVLVSDQVLQNLIPILMERPTRVCLVLTEAISSGASSRMTLPGASVRLGARPSSAGWTAVLNAWRRRCNPFRARRARIRLVPPAELQHLRDL
ncbi:MAG: hypothetical protein ACLFTD_12515, partial [Halochromatium sp.]